MAHRAYDQNIVVDLEFTPSIRTARKHGVRQIYEVIEIGAVRVSPDGRVLDEFRCLVKPEMATSVSGKVRRLTGITTHMLEDAPRFAEALLLFSEWVGKGRTRMVAWSENDKAQIISECAMKEIEMPANMRRWMDLQRVFPRAMDMRGRHKRMSLHDAFAWFDRELSADCEHQALADAEHTAELLVALIKGEHLEHKRALEAAMTNVQPCGYNPMASALAGLLEKMNEAA